jgi:hypothetical protein
LAHKNFAEQAHPSKQQPYKFSEFSVLSVDKEKILIADQWEKSTAFFRIIGLRMIYSGFGISVVVQPGAVALDNAAAVLSMAAKELELNAQQGILAWQVGKIVHREHPKSFLTTKCTKNHELF